MELSLERPIEKQDTGHFEWFKYSSESRVVENFFSEAEMEEIFFDAFKGMEHRKFRSSQLSVFLNNGSFFSKYSSKLAKELPLFQSPIDKNGCNEQLICQGLFFFQVAPSDVHVDMPTVGSLADLKNMLGDTSVYPYKHVIIPMNIFGDSEKSGDFVTYIQRTKGASTYFRDKSEQSNLKSRQNIAEDNKDVAFFDHRGIRIPYEPCLKISEEQYNKQFTNIGRNPLMGMEVENIFPFKAGSLIIFDSHQLHSGASYFQAHGKCGLIFLIFRYVRK